MKRNSRRTLLPLFSATPLKINMKCGARNTLQDNKHFSIRPFSCKPLPFICFSRHSLPRQGLIKRRVYIFSVFHTTLHCRLSPHRNAVLWSKTAPSWLQSPKTETAGAATAERYWSMCGRFRFACLANICIIDCCNWFEAVDIPRRICNWP